VLRDVVWPESGDLLITEVFGDATGSDTAKEWVELYVAGTKAVDLNGLRVAATGTGTRVARVAELACVRGEPGDYLVLGGSADSAANGGVAIDVVAEGLERDGGMLVNSGGAVELWRGQELIDRAQVPDFDQGHSMSLEPLDLSSAGNDTRSSFCPGRSTGLFDGAGTPGGANDPCRSCWTGSAYREPISPTPGDLVLTELLPNPAGADSGQEWIELYVAADRPVDLMGLHLENQAGALRTLRVTGTDCASANPGAFVLLGGEFVELPDLPLNALLAGGDLYNDGATLSLLSGAVVIDAIPTYNDPGSGVSWSLDPSVLDASGNDVATAWCQATDIGVFSGTGSPGLANGTACP
jgi:hypothetical protein